jgi:hypothetical protein
VWRKRKWQRLSARTVEREGMAAGLSEDGWREMASLAGWKVRRFGWRLYGGVVWSRTGRLAGTLAALLGLPLIPKFPLYPSKNSDE